jgi:hypothetical protein
VLGERQPRISRIDADGIGSVDRSVLVARVMRRVGV